MSFWKYIVSSKLARKNLKLMLSRKDRGMQYLLRRESFGGNAGSYKDYACAGANFYFNPNTGEIIEFTNHRKDFVRGTFQLVVFPTDLEEMKRFNVKNIFFKITDIFLPQNCSKEARAVIEESKELYNEKFKIKGIDVI